MPTELGALTAFLIGLLGSVHCVGMCGGIVGALTLGLPPQVRESPSGMFAYSLAYNVGRITSYAIAGMIAGLVGGRFYALISSDIAHTVGVWISGVFMIALGVYLAGWTKILAPIERAGEKLWRYIEPLGRRFLPVRHPSQALALGLVWGWLPCGLVYTALVWAMVSGEALRGSQVMVAFGLGTLPMLLVMGAAARWLAHLARRGWIRRAAAALVIAFGLLTLFVPDLLHRHDGHHVHAGYTCSASPRACRCHCLSVREALTQLALRGGCGYQ